jgi:hypothetical protein
MAGDTLSTGGKHLDSVYGIHCGWKRNCDAFDCWSCRLDAFWSGKLRFGILATLLSVVALLAQSASAGFGVSSHLTGGLIDYWPSHQTVNGDTQYCVLTSATYANGESAGTTTYIDPSGNTNTIRGKVLCTLNDGVFGTTGGNIVVYSLDTLDMTNPAKIHTTLVNAMSSYGTASGATNSPDRWYGKVTSNNLAYNQANWKSDQPISVGGWIILPVFRQEVSPNYAAHDLTLIASPDGGVHWCNPHTFFDRSSGIGCDAVNWDANGDAPKCGAAGYSSACTDTAYLAAANSSMMWQEPTPYNGTTGLMQEVAFFQYCGGADLASCTGMPDEADTYIYAYGHNGNRSTVHLARVAKSIQSILDPKQWQWYEQPGYSPTNVGDGTAWTATGVQAGATVMWASNNVNGSGTGPFYWNAIYYNSPASGGYSGNISYLCGKSTCSYIFPWPQSSSIISMPAPWGPFQSSFNGATTNNYGFAHTLPWTAATIDDNPFHVRLMYSWNNYYWAQANPVTGITKGNPTIITATFPPSWTSANPMHVAIAGETASGWPLNGSYIATPTSSTTFTIPVNSSGWSGSSAGSITWAAQAYGGSEYYQPLDLTVAPNRQGASLLGTSGVQFTMGPSANALSRNGLLYYFDFWDHASNTSYAPLATVDIVHTPPVAALTPCYSNGAYGGCGFYSPTYGTKWESYGMFLAGNGYSLGFQLRDLTTSGGAAINPPLFSGDTAWTISGVTYLTSTAAHQPIFAVGTSPNGFVIGPWNSAGTIGLAWGIGGSGPGIQTAAAVLSTNTWFVWTVTRSPGAVPTSGHDPNTHIYINSVEAPNIAFGAGIAPTITPGPLSLGITDVNTSILPSGMRWAAFGVWGRAMSASEVAHMYRVQKAQMSIREIALP